MTVHHYCRISYHLLHLVGILFPHNNDDARSKSLQIAAVADLVKNDCRIASRMRAESLNILKTAVPRILKEDFGKRKLCARFVLHFLTPEQREDRVTSCQDNIAMADADKHLLTKLLR